MPDTVQGSVSLLYVLYSTSVIVRSCNWGISYVLNAVRSFCLGNKNDFLTESSKSPASIAQSNKQWVGTCLYQEWYKPLLISCEAAIRLWASSEADCEYPLWLKICCSVQYTEQSTDLYYSTIRQMKKVWNSRPESADCAKNLRIAQDRLKREKDSDK